MREKIIEQYLIQEVERRGGFVRKYTSPGRRGVPDRIVFLPGKVIFVEAKTPEGQLSALQKNELQRIEDLGIPVMVINHPLAVDHLMEIYDAQSQSNEL